MRGTGSDPVRVEVLRGDRVESVHAVDLAIVDPAGDTVLRAGTVDEAVFARSAVKPFQALPLLEDGVADRFGITSEEMALCCGSHSGEPEHVAVARGILEKIGLGEEDLACGPHAPFSSAATRALRAEGREPGRLHNNCSGKHAGMLALARGSGWDIDGYRAIDHPVQQRVLDEVARWTRVKRDRIGTAIDGCGVVTFAVPVERLAGAFARLVDAAGDSGGPAARIVAAMGAHPHRVAGSNRLCTAIMEMTDGRIIAKVGAEGVYGAAAVDRSWGIALKARDGARRAAESALVEVLVVAALLTEEEASGLERWRRPVLRNTRDEAVGAVRSRITWKGSE